MICKNDLDCFFSSIDDCNYLVLRGFEELMDSINDGGDIDLLVESIDDFVFKTNAKQMEKRNGCYNYTVNIGDNSIPIDLRGIGDGYYDTKWENDMLNNRVRFGSIYVLSDDLYKYSIYYHCLIHKNSIPDKYKDFLVRNGITGVRHMKCELDNYMIMNNYEYVKPKDMGVQFNKRMYYFRKVHCAILKLKRFFEKQMCVR